MRSSSWRTLRMVGPRGLPCLPPQRPQAGNGQVSGMPAYRCQAPTASKHSPITVKDRIVNRSWRVPHLLQRSVTFTRTWVRGKHDRAIMLEDHINTGSSGRGIDLTPLIVPTNCWMGPLVQCHPTPLRHRHTPPPNTKLPGPPTPEYQQKSH